MTNSLIDSSPSLSAIKAMFRVLGAIQEMMGHGLMGIGALINFRASSLKFPKFVHGFAGVITVTLYTPYLLMLCNSPSLPNFTSRFQLISVILYFELRKFNENGNSDSQTGFPIKVL